MYVKKNQISQIFIIIKILYTVYIFEFAQSYFRPIETLD